MQHKKAGMQAAVATLVIKMINYSAWRKNERLYFLKALCRLIRQKKTTFKVLSFFLPLQGTAAGYLQPKNSSLHIAECHGQVDDFEVYTNFNLKFEQEIIEVTASI